MARDMSSDTIQEPDAWSLGGRAFVSRIIVGTGKYASLEETRAAIDASGAEMVTVALRRIDFSQPGPSLIDAIDRSRVAHDRSRARGGARRSTLRARGQDRG